MVKKHFVNFKEPDENEKIKFFIEILFQLRKFNYEKIVPDVMLDIKKMKSETLFILANNVSQNMEELQQPDVSYIKLLLKIS